MINGLITPELRIDGSRPLIADWNAGTYLIETGNLEVGKPGTYQFRIKYDASNLVRFTVNSSGDLIVWPTGNNLSIGPSAGSLAAATYMLALGPFAGQRYTGNVGILLGWSAGAESISNYLIALNYGAGKRNFGDHSIFAGYLCGDMNLGDRAIGNGYQALELNIDSDVIGIGRYALQHGESQDSIAIGNGAFPFIDNTSGEQFFDWDDIDIANDRITFPSAHGFGANGTYVNLRFTQGTSVVTGMTDAYVYQAKIITSTTIGLGELEGPGGIRRGINITAAGSGTGHKMTPQYKYDNVVAIGKGVTPTQANAIFLAGADHDDVFVGTASDPADLQIPAGLITNNGLTINSRVESLDDDASYQLPSGMKGFIRLMVGDDEEWADIRFSTTVVTIIAGSANVVNTDTDTKFCVFHSGGILYIRNRLGATKEVLIDAKYH